MDPVLLQMMAELSRAKGGNRNLSGLMNNMDNPLLLAMAGVIDPLALQQQTSNTGLYGQYAADPNTPDAVRAIMDYVDQGANKYQIQAQLNQLPDELITQSGYTPEQLDAMAAEMVSQRSKGADKNVFEKAGFRNPSDVYNLSDVPLSPNSVKELVGLQEGFEPISNRLSTERQRGNVARRVMQNNQDAGKVAKELQRGRLLTTSGTSAASMRQLADWIAAQSSISEQSLKAGAERFRPEGRGDAQSFDAALETVAKRLKKDMPDFETNNKKRRKAIKDWEASKMEEAEISAEASNNARLQEAIRMANLKQVAAQGRTPFTDQASQLMKFIAGSK